MAATQYLTAEFIRQKWGIEKEFWPSSDEEEGGSEEGEPRTTTKTNSTNTGPKTTENSDLAASTLPVPEEIRLKVKPGQSASFLAAELALKYGLPKSRVWTLEKRLASEIRKAERRGRAQRQAAKLRGKAERRRQRGGGVGETSSEGFESESEDEFEGGALGEDFENGSDDDGAGLELTLEEYGALSEAGKRSAFGKAANACLGLKLRLRGAKEAAGEAKGARETLGAQAATLQAKWQQVKSAEDPDVPSGGTFGYFSAQASRSRRRGSSFSNGVTGSAGSLSRSRSLSKANGGDGDNWNALRRRRMSSITAGIDEGGGDALKTFDTTTTEAAAAAATALEDGGGQEEDDKAVEDLLAGLGFGTAVHGVLVGSGKGADVRSFWPNGPDLLGPDSSSDQDEYGETAAAAAAGVTEEVGKLQQQGWRERQSARHARGKLKAQRLLNASATSKWETATAVVPRPGQLASWLNFVQATPAPRYEASNSVSHAASSSTPFLTRLSSAVGRRKLYVPATVESAASTAR